MKTWMKEFKTALLKEPIYEERVERLINEVFPNSDYFFDEYLYPFEESDFFYSRDQGASEDIPLMTVYIEWNEELDETETLMRLSEGNTFLNYLNHYGHHGFDEEDDELN